MTSIQSAMYTVHVIEGTRRYEIHVQGTRVSSYDGVATSGTSTSLPLQFTHNIVSVTRCSDMT